jgi:hypothetical protein
MGVLPMALARMPIGDDSDGFVEVEIHSRDLGNSVQLAGAVTDTALMLPFTLASSLDSVRPALSVIVNKLKEHRPNELEVQLGLTVGGESGLIFAKGSAEATFTIKMIWRDTAARQGADPSTTSTSDLP